MDAIYYDDEFPLLGKHRKKYKRKDYSSMVPSGGLHRSLRAQRQSKMPSFMDLDIESA